MNGQDVGSKLVDAKGAPVVKPEAPAADQPKPAPGPKVQVQIVINLFENGQLQVHSDHVNNPMLMYGLMESAKDAVRLHNSRQDAKRVQVPQGPWWRMFGNKRPRA